jgi:glyoxylase-like metal-dependent hydrolase (beta-lactamase superfamily II)
MEVAPRIHRIEAPFGDRFVCMFLLVGDQQALLIDTGTDEMPQQYLVPYLDSIGLKPDRIRYVLNSHADFDHTAGNASVRELCPQAVFMCHALDRDMVENIDTMIDRRYSEWEADHGIGDGDEAKAFIRQCSRHIPIDVALQGGERLRLGTDWDVEIWHTPGHTYGHLTVHDPASNTLIITDTTLYNAVLRADGTPAFPPTYRYVDTYLASMQRITGQGASTLLTSHYPVYTGAGINEFLAESRAYVERVDQALIQEVQAADGPRTLRQLIDVLGPKLGEWPTEASAYLCFPLTGHLERLVQYGRVETRRQDKLLTYRWRS